MALLSRTQAELALAGNLRVAATNVVADGRIKATDAEIDRLVWELYGLTKEKIAIVEGATELAERTD